MIPLIRTRRVPPVHTNFDKEKREEFNVELMLRQRSIKRGDDEKHEFNSTHWGKAKKQLLAETHNKCAYCEAPTAQVAYGDVEHYRPKSKYWWLAYSYENYLVSCQLCNQKYKKAKFPTKNKKMLAPVKIRRNTTDEYISSKKSKLTPDSLDPGEISNFEQLHRMERPYIVNPYVDNPTIWYAWKAFEETGRVRLIARPDGPDSAKFVQAAEHNLGLNRIELQELRFLHYNLFKTFKMAQREPNISDALRLKLDESVSGMLADNAPFAGMLRYFNPML